ncbi:MAG: NUDIX domain-containing protein [Bacteroidetes bacterium]|nr:MAG: NUDIX domain-containing protein [Bacteroidota bacterium]
MTQNQFNIRVYGILIEDGCLLVTDEIRFGIRMTKLPGGGLQFGEGLEKCLQREWIEELNTEIRVGDIFYVNPFLQLSAFRNTDEVIAMYFWVKPVSPLNIPIAVAPMAFESDEDEQQIFRWIPLRDLREADFTFPIDQSLVSRLKKFAARGTAPA